MRTTFLFSRELNTEIETLRTRHAMQVDPLAEDVLANLSIGGLRALAETRLARTLQSAQAK